MIHLRYATRPGAPWAGVSPFGMASETQALAGWIEKRLAEEASATSGYVLTVPDGASDGNVTGLASSLKALAGKLFVTETTAGAWGQGSAAAPKRDYETVRLGANPPPSLASLRQDVRADVLAVYGVPSALHGSGTSARESYRQMLQGTIVPLSKLVVEELAAKLDTPTLAFDFRELRAADIAGRARAYGVLINAGMDQRLKPPKQQDWSRDAGSHSRHRHSRPYAERGRLHVSGRSARDVDCGERHHAGTALADSDRRRGACLPHCHGLAAVWPHP